MKFDYTNGFWLFSIIWQHADQVCACLMRWTNDLKQNLERTQNRRQRQSPNKATVTNTDLQQVVSDFISCGKARKAKEHKSRICCHILKVTSDLPFRKGYHSVSKKELLILNFRRVLNVVCFLLGHSPASEFCVPTFRNILYGPSS